jgi:hypothetical protein
MYQFMFLLTEENRINHGIAHGQVSQETKNAYFLEVKKIFQDVGINVKNEEHVASTVAIIECPAKQKMMNLRSSI